MNEHAQHKYHFFVDDKKYETDQTGMSGLQIKTLASVPANYQLFLEAHGEHPDEAISDATTVSFVKEVKKLYSVPPATFGAR